MDLVVPGEELNGPADAEPGSGVYLENGKYYASLVGGVHIDNSVLSVVPLSGLPNQSHIPLIGQSIIGSISKVTPRYASIDIKVLISPSCPSTSFYLNEPFKGTIRIQDILSEQDSQELMGTAGQGQVFQYFRPSDLVRGRVVGVGDSSAGFLVSTGLDDQDGVIFAKAAVSGEPMVPVAWNEMVCSKTASRESRKCAKPSL